MFFASSRADAYAVRVACRHADKGQEWEPVQRLEHLRPEFDSHNGTLTGPTEHKLELLHATAHGLIRRAKHDKRWLPVQELASSTCRAQFLFVLAIKHAQFYLRELHNVLYCTKDSWGGRVKMTHQLERDLEWRGVVPTHSYDRSIYKPVVTCMSTAPSTVGDNMDVVYILANLNFRSNSHD
eukprot:jgi/Tetstr1/427023/TSEL_017228.t1